MAFRRPQNEAETARQWRDFLWDERELFGRSRVPSELTNRRTFDDFLMHGFVPLPGGLADGVAFDLDELSGEQQAALGQLIVKYLSRFENPGTARAIELLLPE